MSRRYRGPWEQGGTKNLKRHSITRRGFQRLVKSPLHYLVWTIRPDRNLVNWRLLLGVYLLEVTGVVPETDVGFSCRHRAQSAFDRVQHEAALMKVRLG